MLNFFNLVVAEVALDEIDKLLVVIIGWDSVDSDDGVRMVGGGVAGISIVFVEMYLSRNGSSISEVTVG